MYQGRRHGLPATSGHLTAAAADFGIDNAAHMAYGL